MNHTAIWIGRAGARMNNHRQKTLPAPYFRRKFDCRPPAGAVAELRICGLGFYELYLNGVRVGDRELDPMPGIYDRHHRFVRYDVTGYLRPGENVCGVILGNGWYNALTHCSCELEQASWRDYPKLQLELRIDGRLVMVSDPDWRVSSEGPILFDAIRNGECYDARREFAGWLSPDFDDTDWPNAVRVHPPGGFPQEQLSPPCRVLEQLPAKMISERHGVYDIGANIAGRLRIKVTGSAGAAVTIHYAERISADGDLDLTTQDIYVFTGDYQTDRYILSGDGEECWAPRFAYHGFQYCKVVTEGPVQIVSLTAERIGTDFTRIGRLRCFTPELDRLEACAIRSFQSNYVGIPTDCPQREKNGWTGDAQLACETGMYHFDAGVAYFEWLEMLLDCQRPNGQLPGIIPTAGWGFNWGSGPAWDSALFIIPETIWRFTGDDRPIRRFYDAMRRYLDFMEQMSDRRTVYFGLGDWCAPDPRRIPPSGVTDTGYYFYDVRLVARLAKWLGFDADAAAYAELGREIAAAFDRQYRNAAGLWGTGSMTEIAAALYFGLADAEQCRAGIRNLAALVREKQHRADFGILGAKYIPRVLADHGYVDDALRIITQPEYPGWVHSLRQGATTLWERWDGSYSRNHVMFGDFSAWLFRYPGGLDPHYSFGEAYLGVKPCFPAALSKFQAEYRGCTVRWERLADEISLEIAIPAGCQVRLELPGRPAAMLPGGQTFCDRLPGTPPPEERPA